MATVSENHSVNSKFLTSGKDGLAENVFKDDLAKRNCDYLYEGQKFLECIKIQGWIAILARNLG